MKRWRTFLERLPGGHSPPTGPLTTTEADAAELRQQTLARGDDASGREQKDAGDREP